MNDPVVNDRVTNWAFYIIVGIMFAVGFAAGWRLMDYIRTLL